MERKRKKWDGYSGTRRVCNKKRKQKYTKKEGWNHERNGKEKPDYYEYIQSVEWRRKRLERIKIDEFQCQMCGSGGVLNVHHLTYKRLGHEKMGDLLTLCPACHEKIHDALRKQA